MERHPVPDLRPRAPLCDLCRMQPDDIHIDDDIRRAASLPGAFYGDVEIHALTLERVFARSWHWVGEAARVCEPGQCLPLTLLPGGLDVPVVVTRDADGVLHGFSNACTHRGMLVCEEPGRASALRCRYHGRRFTLGGRFVSMPEFEGAEDFPSPADDLPAIEVATWGPLLFASLSPSTPFDAWTAELRRRFGWLPLERLTLDTSRSRDYVVEANWALYLDNYLEGFHVPYVHAGLVGPLDYGRYRTELFPESSVQVGIAGDGEEAFDLPAASPDRGQRVGGYYVWLFPSTMLNFYPWGLSLNVAVPLGPEKTKICFRSYVMDASKLERGAGADLHRVEMEDEAVVEAAQRGVRSRLYQRGRYSPEREQGVHHFQRLLARALRASA